MKKQSVDTPFGQYLQYASASASAVRITFDANTDNSSETSTIGNPMKDHADGSEIHPYNIKMLPLIAY